MIHPRDGRSADDPTLASVLRFAWKGGATVLAVLLVASAQAGAPSPDFDEEARASESSADSSETRPDAPLAAPKPAPPRATAKPVASSKSPGATRPKRPARPVLDPSARLLGGDDASEAWTLFIDLASGHRVTQRFLLSNAGPGEHSAVAIGHLVEPGRAPYRYENGRRRPRWTLSDDRLFFDIAASHLDLHRPTGELRITKDDIEIRLFFDFAAERAAARVPETRLPPGYQVEVLAVGAPTRGSIKAPWMAQPLDTTGHTWLVHTWTDVDESSLLDRRVDVFGRTQDLAFYGLQLRGRGDWESGWSLSSTDREGIIESGINVSSHWEETAGTGGDASYPTPKGFVIRGGPISGRIDLAREWLRFDPLEVIPQPFRWFIRRSSKPQEVWADAQIGVSISTAPDTPSLPIAGETTSAKFESVKKMASRSKRETEDETANRSVTGVASITFLNPMSRR